MISRKTLKRMSMVTGVVTMMMGISISYDSYATEETDYTSGNGGGCYTSTLVECPLIGGYSKVCDFTGVYGPPITCTGTDCAGDFTDTRHCVAGG